MTERGVEERLALAERNLEDVEDFVGMLLSLLLATEVVDKAILDDWQRQYLGRYIDPDRRFVALQSFGAIRESADEFLAWRQANAMPAPPSPWRRTPPA